MNDKPVKIKILIAASEPPFAATLANYLEVDGYRVERCHDAKGFLRLLGRQPFDIMVLDLELGEQGDMDLVTFARRQRPQAQIILLVDIGKIDRAIEGIRRGAFFYLPRTSMPSDVALVVHLAYRKLNTESALSGYQWDLFEQMLGRTPAMRRVIEIVTKVAPTDSTVLLLGESGTGKDVLAGAIHRLSPRRDMPFIAINCAALPEALLESEMFGHLKGSFTGANADKRGLFEEADGGTVFLDEIGDMAPVTQAKLLRVLQNGEIRPVGSAVSRRVNVRVIAATNMDLEEAVRDNHFREDLYFRLNVIQIRIPPLRERPDALTVLVRHFLHQYGEKFGKNIADIDPHAQALLRDYHYPGNVRELESIIAHGVIMADSDTLRPADLPDHVRRSAASRPALPYLQSGVPQKAPTLNQMEEQLIRATLDRFDANQTKTAKTLGISRSTLWRKMRQYGIGPANEPAPASNHIL
ncbi:MAG TPA: sigma-54 dependent transcriptional regulator [Candidatus Bathyarchaeia archaeon]|nr:sigma-54 dependent transcriptional regulator [Candidatus Bathyarchaeia archaeon]